MEKFGNCIVHWYKKAFLQRYHGKTLRRCYHNFMYGSLTASGMASDVSYHNRKVLGCKIWIGIGGYAINIQY